MIVGKFINRIYCYLRGYHIKDSLGVYKFRYDCTGICYDCGKVGSGIALEDGE